MQISHRVPSTSLKTWRAMPTKRSTRVYAEQPINPDIRKSEAKVVDKVDVSDKDKPQVFCRCWRSSTFPMCDAAHVKHNEATGDNVGPLIIECGKK